jgi:hypothetical protein
MITARTTYCQILVLSKTTLFLYFDLQYEVTSRVYFAAIVLRDSQAIAGELYVRFTTFYAVLLTRALPPSPLRATSQENGGAARGILLVQRTFHDFTSGQHR